MSIQREGLNLATNEDERYPIEQIPEPDSPTESEVEDAVEEINPSEDSMESRG